MPDDIYYVSGPDGEPIPTHYTPFQFNYSRDHVDPITQKVTGVAVKTGIAIQVTADKRLRVNWGRVSDHANMTTLDPDTVPEFPCGRLIPVERVQAFYRRLGDWQMRVLCCALLALKEGRVEEIKE